MTHQYQLTGMTCESCESKVKNALLALDNVISVDVSKEKNSATVTMNKHIEIDVLQNALGTKYQISEIVTHEKTTDKQSWLTTYKPVLLILVYILLVTITIEISTGQFELMRWMNHFMAGFFLTFSFFKFLNLKEFKESYAMYDIVAKKIPVWGFVYVFVELGLGFAYLTEFNSLITNLITSIVMSVSIVGVLQSVLNKRAIRCACLGTVFNLPMSTITIIEDGLMILMSAGMLIMVLLG